MPHLKVLSCMCDGTLQCIGKDWGLTEQGQTWQQWILIPLKHTIEALLAQLMSLEVWFKDYVIQNQVEGENRHLRAFRLRHLNSKATGAIRPDCRKRQGKNFEVELTLFKYWTLQFCNFNGRKGEQCHPCLSRFAQHCWELYNCGNLCIVFWMCNAW